MKHSPHGKPYSVTAAELTKVEDVDSGGGDATVLGDFSETVAACCASDNVLDRLKLRTRFGGGSWGPEIALESLGRLSGDTDGAACRGSFVGLVRVTGFGSCGPEIALLRGGRSVVTTTFLKLEGGAATI